MSEYTLYISLEQKQPLKLKSILSKLADFLCNQSIRIVWLSANQVLTAQKINSALKYEKQFKNNNIYISHTIEVLNVARITPLASFVLYQYGFGLILHASNYSDVRETISKEIAIKKSLIHGHIVVDSYSESDYFQWLSNDDDFKIQPFLDITKLCFDQEPIACKYNSCLAKSIYIDENCNLGFCPYIKNKIQLERIEKCDSFEQLFEGTGFIEILYKQIQKRNDCMQKCQQYNFCKGGCPLEDECENCNIVEMIQKAELLELYDIKSNAAKNLYKEYMLSLANKFRV